MSERRVILSDEMASPDASIAEPAKVNPMDALNRRDIELIKRSLASLHKDCAELRETIVALHARQSTTPTRGFFLTCAVVAFVAVLAISIARPQLDSVLHGSTAVAQSNNSAIRQ